MIESFVTKEMLYELARTNHIVRSAMMAVEHGHLDYTSALAQCVYYLAKDSEEKSKMLVKHMQMYIPPIIKTDSK